MLIITFLGIAVGLILGLTGAGGGILAVPALVMGMQWSMTQAAPIALIAVGLAAATGALDGLQKGQVRYKAALLMAGAGALSAPLGILLAHQLPEAQLKFIFAALMLFVALRMLRGVLLPAPAYQPNRPKPCKLNQNTGKFIWTTRATLTIGAIGGVSGLFTGLLGVGGGFLLVPALHRYTQLNIHSIVSTSLMVIALISGSTVVIALWKTQTACLGTWFFVVSVILGMLFGRHYAPRIAAQTIQLGFAVLCLVAALIVLFEAIACLN